MRTGVGHHAHPAVTHLLQRIAFHRIDPCGVGRAETPSAIDENSLAYHLDERDAAAIAEQEGRPCRRRAAGAARSPALAAVHARLHGVCVARRPPAGRLRAYLPAAIGRPATD